MAKRKGPTPKRRVQHPKQRWKPRGRSTRVLLAALVLGGIAVILGVLAVARNSESTGGGNGVGTLDAGPVHVHGLGINPADRSLLIATHTGTYRVPPTAKKATRVGDSRQDTMGFSVVGPNYFLGSGHPDMREAVEKDLPPLLGLIESRDAGKTWRSISLLGEADFHVLRLGDKRVYGYDASNDRLLVSSDAGRTWREVSRPAPLLDLAVDPASARRVIASGEGGLYLSADQGLSWRKVGPQVGLLAWPSADRLYLVEADGAVRRSADEGQHWSRLGNVGGQPAALLAQTESELYVALHNGTIMQSSDGGRSWSLRSAP